MRRLLVVVLSVLVVLVVVGVVADRVIASVAERAIAERVAHDVPGSRDTSVSIDGRLVLPQVARGSLDHVTVRMSNVPTRGGLTVESVEADLYGVTTSAPRTAERVDALAHVSTSALQAQVGDRYTISVDGDSLVASLPGALPVQARVRPAVRDGKLALDLTSVSILGLKVDASRLPASLSARITALAGSFGRLPLGLVPTSAVVTPSGIDVRAQGTRVALEGA